MIPWQLKDAVRGVLAIPQRRRTRRERTAIRKASGSEPILSFGGVLNQSFIHGGAVKLLSLRDDLRHDETHFNVLYLVSSALPAFAEDLVRACRDRGIRFVWNQNGVAYPAWAGAESERLNGPMRRLREQADYLVYQSDFCRVSADQFLGPATAPHITLFNPVALDRFLPGDELPEVPLRLLAAGTHGYRERVTSTLECLKNLRARGINASLTLAGKMEWPGADAEVTAWITRHQLPVQLVPPFTQAEAARLYQHHHLLLHPKYLDPCPTVVVEALASGLPVIGSRSGGLPEMVSPESSRLVSVPLDWKNMHTPSGAEMADAIVDLLPKLPAARTAARAHAVATFDREHWVKAHRDIFNRLLNE